MSKSLGNVLDPFEVMDAVRHRRAALLLLPRGLASARTARLDDAFERALRDRAGQRVRQPRQPHAGDDRPLPRRRRARRRRRPGAGGGLRRPARGGRGAARPRRDHPGARADLAARAAAQPLRRGARAVAARQGRGAGRRARPRRCARWPRACASSPCCSPPYMPETADKLLAALGAPDDARWTARATARAGRRARREASPPLFPKPRAVIDSHTHLDLRAGARGRAGGRGARGGRQADAHGRDRRATRAARRSPPPRPTTRCTPRSAATPTTRPATTTRSSPSCASSPRTRAACAIGETGLDYYRDYAPRADQERAFRRPHRARARDRQAARDPHARGRGRHDRDARPSTREALEVILHCFSMPDRLDECLEHGWWISFAGNVTYPKAAGPARRRPSACPLDRLLVETDAPYLTPQAVRKQRNQPAYVVHTAALRRRAPRHRLRGARGGRSRRNAAAAARAGERASPRSRACAGMRQFGDPAQPRARPELPDRLEHPRRDRRAPRS